MREELWRPSSNIPTSSRTYTRILKGNNSSQSIYLSKEFPLLISYLSLLFLSLYLYLYLYRFHLSYALDPTSDASDNKEWKAKLRKLVPSKFDRVIFKTFLTFNRHILKTNFYKSSKVALSFRLDPAFLNKDDYPVIPFGLFFVVGAEFRGFHVRFRDVARGGIRIIRSGNSSAFLQNVTTVFDENYNLAATQERKNKDIAEGGSKGKVSFPVLI